MPVLQAHAVCLEVPSLDAGIKFYSDAGLEVQSDGRVARCRCTGSDADAIVLIGGAQKKRLHHIALRADGLDEIASRTTAAGGTVTEAPEGFNMGGLWIRDPHGMLIHLVDQPAASEVSAAAAFEINGPGRIVRASRSAMRSRGTYSTVKPRRLGHILVFTPDVLRSVAFVTEALGMGLADRAEDVVAFCCARKNSDHHVVAFGKSAGIGFHHVSFQVADPDEVGRGGRELVEKSQRGDWGFGRHTIGSNFFHYIQDPWGSWFEYFSDMDHIDNYESWTPTTYGMADSLANWGPPAPRDFVRNHEIEETAAVS
jgi:catechol 2,3-dioxygenase-like lactoylglutathione lyase family enzyme